MDEGVKVCHISAALMIVAASPPKNMLVTSQKDKISPYG